MPKPSPEFAKTGSAAPRGVNQLRHGERGAVAVEGGRATDHLIQQEKPALVVPDKATDKSGLYRAGLAGEVRLKTVKTGRGGTKG